MTQPFDVGGTKAALDAILSLMSGLDKRDAR